MKTAIYIEDGVTQIVLTPETSWEKKILDEIDLEKHTLTPLRGSFYECQGGYFRNKTGEFLNRICDRNPKDESLMLRIDSIPEPTP